MADRRRINPPLGPTSVPTFAPSPSAPSIAPPPHRTRQPHEIRKIFLKTGLTPSASGSAYLELEPSPLPPHHNTSLIYPPTPSTLKITCTLHGPRPLPRTIPFSPHLLLTCTVKFAPFALRHRRSYIRDTDERDLSVHVETALRGLLISERWPKSGVDICITVLEGEDDDVVGSPRTGLSEWPTMSILSGCMTVASAAIADAGIDIVDLVSGGVAAIVRQPNPPSPLDRRNVNVTTDNHTPAQIVLDPCPSEHGDVLAVCVVGYLRSRDEITEIWTRGDVDSGLLLLLSDTEGGGGGKGSAFEMLMDKAVEAAVEARRVLEAALREAAEFKLRKKG
ncbi:MAG: hypothetical protein Q9182_005030 [Xanthomendoza sp. 2 TL-2023]